MRTHIRDQLKEIEEGFGLGGLGDLAMKGAGHVNPVIAAANTYKVKDKASGLIEWLRKKGDKFTGEKYPRSEQKAKPKSEKKGIIQWHKEKIKAFNKNQHDGSPKPTPKPENTTPKPENTTPKPENKGGFTQAHAIGGTALAAGLGLGVHHLYKKYKKRKEKKKFNFG